MTDRIIYHTPGACSRVVLIALERIGAAYAERAVSLMTGEQYQPPFQAINARGKVPVLVEDGAAVTEAPVILYYLAESHPEAALLPAEPDGRPTLAALSDLVWVAGVLHPLGARLMRPTAVCASDPEGVREIALAQLSQHAASIERRLGDEAWWYGSDWSIVDAFVAWAFALAATFGFPLGHYPLLAAHRRRAEAVPAFASARALEIVVAERHGLSGPPGLTL